MTADDEVKPRKSRTVFQMSLKGQQRTLFNHLVGACDEGLAVRLVPIANEVAVSSDLRN